ncbi:bifunctional cytidylyltransferase/SDR family oxidoreductase [Streptomyces sp. NPDC102340]|uniref:bifunctional cytidylyltransferase/SDR family oxidoreductase n=1 Tax=unclassified Streptomyces TaxID=2593676 RepID=UPI002E27140A
MNQQHESGQKTGRTVAVVLAGGTGTRVGLAVPKQLVKIAGKTIIEHTLDVFERAPDVDEIIVLMVSDFVPQLQKIVDAAGYEKVSRVIPGGTSRNETTRRALGALGAKAGVPPEENLKVLFHDSVRPLLSQRIVADCIAALDRYDAVDVAIPSADTIAHCRTHGTDGEFITSIPDRSRLRRGQTPQGFRLATLWQAYERASVDPNFEGTDDCSIVLRYLPDVPVHVVRGEEHNMKITHPVDVFLTDKLFQLASSVAPESLEEAEYRKRLDGRTVVIFGASYGIGADIADIARSHGANVFANSRSGTGTYVEHPEHIERALTEAYEETGRVDYVVNTAGVLRIGKLAESSTETIEEATAVNYLAPVHMARFAHRYLAETKGQLLLYTSSSYTRGRGSYSLYSSAKAATVNLTQALADEWASDGIRVNCINPERTATPMRTNAFGDEPSSSLLTSEAVAQSSVDVLVSPLTGHVIDIRRQDPTLNTVGDDFYAALVAGLEE